MKCWRIPKIELPTYLFQKDSKPESFFYSYLNQNLQPRMVTLQVLKAVSFGIFLSLVRNRGGINPSSGDVLTLYSF
jgi:hypothetical protein